MSSAGKCNFKLRRVEKIPFLRENKIAHNPAAINR